MTLTPSTSIQAGPAESSQVSSAIVRTGRTLFRDVAYLIASGALAVIAFGLVGALSVVACALMIIYIGRFVFVVPMSIARASAHLQRGLLVWRGESISALRYARVVTSDPQTWLELRHDPQVRRDVNLSLALVFVSVVTLGVTTQLAFWSVRAIVNAILSGAQLGDLGIAPWLAAVLGVLGLVVLPVAIRALAGVQANGARSLLGAARPAFIT